MFHKLIVNGSKKLKTLHNCLLTIICNISPYAKSLSSVASMKVLGLFEIFASTRFLFRSQNAHQYVFFLLDVFNNLIQCVRSMGGRVGARRAFQPSRSVWLISNKCHRARVGQCSGG